MASSAAPTRAALVTGASRGLGRALARGLAAAGWTLLLDGRDPATLEAIRAELAERTRVVALPGDVADPRHRATAPPSPTPRARSAASRPPSTTLVCSAPARSLPCSITRSTCWSRSIAPT